MMLKDILDAIVHAYEQFKNVFGPESTKKKIQWKYVLFLICG